MNIRCPFCKELLVISEEEIDSAVKCPRCRSPFIYGKKCQSNQHEAAPLGSSQWVDQIRHYIQAKVLDKPLLLAGLVIAIVAVVAVSALIASQQAKARDQQRIERIREENKQRVQRNEQCRKEEEEQSRREDEIRQREREEEQRRSEDEIRQREREEDWRWQNPVRVSAESLYTAYENNEVAADELYKGKVLLVSGQVVKIGKTIFGTAYVQLAGEGEWWRDTYIGSGITCYFQAGQESSLTSLTKGGSCISIVGECNGKAFLDVTLAKCRTR
jgi:phage FluMu protein Com